MIKINNNQTVKGLARSIKKVCAKREEIRKIRLNTRSASF